MHVTIRMAWHDNNWNGTICARPEENSYCVGTHSLLSGRIEKKRDLDFEKASPGIDVSKIPPDKIPPCYWSLNAFGKKNVQVKHGHAFSWLNLDPIPDTLAANSVYTWPFKLSFVHNDKNHKKHGNYPPDLEQRIERFIDKFTLGESIIFFYANYDNPVSADEMRYLLLGCSVLAEKPKKTWFKINPAALKEIRGRSQTMKNFPTINWALQFTHDPACAVLLPYKEYLEYVEQNPEDEEQLAQMRVLIEEESLVSGFKYVAMDIEDDKCLYLLYKLRKAIKRIQEHGQAVVKSDLAVEEQRVEDLIKKAWTKRGIYPSLATIFDLYLDDSEISKKLAASLDSSFTNLGS